MSNKDLYNIVGGIAKTMLTELVDKAVESSKNVGNFVDEEIKAKFDSKPEEPLNKAIPNENEFMQLFINQLDCEVTPSWNRVELRFVDNATNREFIAFKNGYLLAKG